MGVNEDLRSVHATPLFRRGACGCKPIAVLVTAVFLLCSMILLFLAEEMWAQVRWKLLDTWPQAALLNSNQGRGEIATLSTEWDRSQTLWGTIQGIPCQVEIMENLSMVGSHNSTEERTIGCEELVKEQMRERETCWAAAIDEMKQREVALNEKIERLRRREVETNVTLNARVAGLKKADLDQQQLYVERIEAAVALTERLKQRETEFTGMAEALSRREVELNTTFFLRIEELRSRIQQLEEEKEHAVPRLSASTSTTLDELATHLLDKLQNEPTDNQTGCHSYGRESIHSMWFPWEVGLGYEKYDVEKTIKCFNSLPNKHVAFVGDSTMQSVFHEVMHKLGQVNHDDIYKNLGVESEFVFISVAHRIEHTFRRNKKVWTADVIIVGTGAWEIRMNPDPNTLVMMSYIAGLSLSIKYLQDNFKGRVIFVMTPPLSHERVGHLNVNNPFQSERWNSKIQALNRFATKLVLGAGFEVLDLFDFLTTGEGGFINYANLTTEDYFHPNANFSKLAADIYLNEICRKVEFGYDTPTKISNLTKSFNGTRCKLH